VPISYVRFRNEVVWLTDEAGNVLGALAGVDEDDLDDLLAQTPAFQALIARSRDSLESGKAVSVHDFLAEAQAELASRQ
jgi:hypothetical protein